MQYLKHGLSVVAIRVAVVLLAAFAPGSLLAAGRFVTSQDGKTVTDLATKLTWQRKPPTTGGTWNTGEFTTSAAAQYCTANVAGLPGMGWRLPTVRELLSIVNRRVSSTLDPAFLCCSPTNQFWTSTPYKQSTAIMWFVAFYKYAAQYPDGPGYSMAVRCVRGP